MQVGGVPGSTTGKLASMAPHLRKHRGGHVKIEVYLLGSFEVDRLAGQPLQFLRPLQRNEFRTLGACFPHGFFAKLP